MKPIQIPKDKDEQRLLRGALYAEKLDGKLRKRDIRLLAKLNRSLRK